MVLPSVFGEFGFLAAKSPEPAKQLVDVALKLCRVGRDHFGLEPLPLKLGELAARDEPLKGRPRLVVPLHDACAHALPGDHFANGTEEVQLQAEKWVELAKKGIGLL